MRYEIISRGESVETIRQILKSNLRKDIVRYSRKLEKHLHNLPGWVQLPAPQQEESILRSQRSSVGYLPAMLAHSVCRRGAR